MNLDELTRLFDAIRASVFRLETLDRYTVPSEAEALADFLAGRPRLPRTPENSPWVRRIADDVAAGRRVYRVHLISHPLSHYLRFELSGYAETAAVGQEAFIADRDAHPDLAELTEDFWLFDDATVAVMRYDDEGHFLGADLAPEELLDEYRRRRDLALAHAVPLDEYLATVGGLEALKA
ncbi:MAG: DUF6879 family protein [Pseudonocardiaceae bacterium]